MPVDRDRGGARQGCHRERTASLAEVPVALWAPRPCPCPSRCPVVARGAGRDHLAALVASGPVRSRRWCAHESPCLARRQAASELGREPRRHHLPSAIRQPVPMPSPTPSGAQSRRFHLGGELGASCGASGQEQERAPQCQLSFSSWRGFLPRWVWARAREPRRTATAPRPGGPNTVSRPTADDSRSFLLSERTSRNNWRTSSRVIDKCRLSSGARRRRAGQEQFSTRDGEQERSKVSGVESARAQVRPTGAATASTAESPPLQPPTGAGAAGGLLDSGTRRVAYADPAGPARWRGR